MHHLRFRQIHLDFHTSEQIEGIGERFDKAHWQATLKKANVNSVTCFATCHHGWAYYETAVGEKHPHLTTDLLREQFDACKEIDVNVPIYLTAGVNNMAAVKHPEWRQAGPNGNLTGWAPSNIAPGFFRMCFNTPYLDFLCKQITEVVTLFPDCSGIFLDIISQPPCVCHTCLETMEAQGLDPLNPEDRAQHSKNLLLKYYQRTTAAAKVNDPDMPVFHNSGHITQGDTDILEYFSHLELESLPTGGWGYDHFPMSAKYCTNLPHDVMGMTGKFHTTWGEFGGFKHPNALRYECAAMIAVGAKCSVGDQLHPLGKLDDTTYDVIGAAYREVAEKEAWCDGVTPITDIGLLASAAVNRGTGGHRDNAPDTGAGRILLEGHVLFDILDESMDFSGRKALLLPDDIRVNPELKAKIDAYLAQGSKLILTGTSGLNETGDAFLWDIGADFHGISDCQPDYVEAIEGVRPDFVGSPLVMYMNSCRIKATTGQSLGQVSDPYFNRNYKHFCSHQHAPNKPEASGFDCGVINGNILYLAHPVFSLYRAYGAVAYRHYATNAIRTFLANDLTVSSNLPGTARLHLNRQDAETRYVLHLLYANTILRGGSMEMHGGTVRSTKPIEVVEELLPLHDVQVSVSVPEAVTKVTLEPQGENLAFEQADGAIRIALDAFTCHQMVVLHY
ncbi:MAG: hypothetical protein HN742_36645 [Lentisphaerae bacterium]|jgi:hypothetical protein|nr:hypothetical protein [Lentisphaerota bacterium]MBT4820450.1 hypothetical protein [Lentisphaerota bacterium]MBT5609251.1 hypothetical protein [Lentisphaerota bacterium]MBT7055272.1 hypothetical protein [Lentisphaerota bacterium]MBT7847455.1 hypothetical protein [Lentisphaerota bacterium]